MLIDDLQMQNVVVTWTGIPEIAAGRLLWRNCHPVYERTKVQNKNADVL